MCHYTQGYYTFPWVEVRAVQDGDGELIERRVSRRRRGRRERRRGRRERRRKK